MELYRKHRPQSLKEIVGNTAAKLELTGILKKQQRPHTFLFVGHAGCGKTTMAHILAKELGLKNVIEQNSADYRGIDSVREFAKTLEFIPMGGSQGYIFEEAHKLTNDAQEALLKPVENCPSHTYLFFTTTDPSKLCTAIKTRMVIIGVQQLTDAEMQKVVSNVAEKEGLELSEDVITHVAKSGYGSPRRALSLLEKVIGLPYEEQLQVAGYHDEAESVAIDLCRLIVKGGTWEEIATVLGGLTVEPEGVRRAMLGYLRAILLRKSSPRAFLLAQHFKDNYYNTGNVGLVLSCYSAWLEKQ